MYRSLPNYRSDVVNTDKYGFRISHLQDRRTISLENINAFDNLGLVVGGSTAFGVGSSTDDRTISSRLNQKLPDLNWVNIGGRAYQSLQELLVLLMFVPWEKVKAVVMFTGINSAYLSLYNEFRDQNVPFFFSFSNYWQSQMESWRKRYRLYQIPWLQKSLRKMMGKYPMGSLPFPFGEEQVSEEQRLKLGMARSLKDLNVINIMAQSYGVKIFYFLQPLGNKNRKSLSPEEIELFSVLDEMGQGSNFLKKIAGSLSQFENTHVDFCRANGIPYLNTQQCVTSDEWLFVDRAHINDKANDLISNAMEQVIKEHL